MSKKQRTLDQQIADALRESHEMGELQRAKGWGKPLDFGDGYDETPADLRMGFKILKDAGVAPVEVEIMREIQALERSLAELDPQGDEAVALRRKISDLRLDVSLRIEALAKRS
jgi:DnaJ-like protein